MLSNLPPGVTDSMLPGNRPEDQENEVILILSVGEIKDIRCELENQMAKGRNERSLIWYVLENIDEQLREGGL